MDSSKTGKPRASRGRRRAPSNLVRRGKTWQFRAQVDGRDVRKSLGEITVEEARAQAAQILRELKERSPDVPIGGRLFSTVAIEWQETYVDTGRLGDSTAKRYVTSLESVRRYLEGVPLLDVDMPFLVAMVRKRQAAGAKNSTINRDLSAISAVFEHAIESRYAEANPARTFNRRKHTPEKMPNIVMPTADVIERIAASTDTRFGDLVRFLAATGLRLNEATQLQWSNVRRTGGVIALTLTRTKRSKIRTMELSVQAAAILDRQEKDSASDYVFHHGGEDFKNASSRFSVMSRRLVAELAREGVVFKRFRAHDLRHYWAVTSLQGGMGIYAVGRQLGHGSVKTTERYLRYLTQTEADNATRG